MASELAYEASDEASENELLERSLSVWRGWNAHDVEDFAPVPLDLHTACSIGHYEYVRNLVNRSDIEVDCKNRGGWTSLMYACYIGHEHIASLLLDAGCNVNIKNGKGQSPLMLAASCGNENVGRTLCRNGAELEAWDRQGWTALFHATYAGHQNFVCFLLEQGANLNAVEPASGMTPFLQAAAEGHEIIVQLLLQGGVDVNTRSVHGDTARSLALVNGHIKIVSLIDHHVMPPATSLRSDPGLEGYLSSSDEARPPSRPQHHGRGFRVRSRGPSIRDGPDAIARLIDRTHGQEGSARPVRGGAMGAVPQGYLSFPQGEGEREGQPRLSYRDVTSPINLQDYALDSSGGKDSCDYEYEGNAFSQTGAITIKSSSSSSGGLAAALGLSRNNSLDSDDPLDTPPRPSILPESTAPTTPPEQGGSLRTVSPEEKVSDYLCNMQLNDAKDASQGRSPTVACSAGNEVTSPGEEISTRAEDGQRGGWGGEEGGGDTARPPHWGSLPPEGRRQPNLARGSSCSAVVPQRPPPLPPSLAMPSEQTSEFGQALLQNPTLLLQPSSLDADPPPLHPRPPETWSVQRASQGPRFQSPGFRVQDTFGPSPLPEAGAPSRLPASLSGEPTADQLCTHTPPSSRPQEGGQRDQGEGVLGVEGDCQYPRDLGSLLAQLGLGKYLTVLEEQDIDLQVFLSLTDNDLKEIGIKLFGPRKKMTNAIARWHSKAPLQCTGYERAYADRLEGEMQELAIQLNQAVLEVEHLRGQVQQEQQLRSVAEGCLMEERGLWQGVRQRIQELCKASAAVQQTACQIKRLQEELRNAVAQRSSNKSLVAMETANASVESLLSSTDFHTRDLLQTASAATRIADLLLATLSQAPPPNLPPLPPYS